MAIKLLNSPDLLVYRPDIDGLRALAVLAVILFHAFPNLLPSGFIGVDIFFVISGYLITSILLSDLQRSHWSIARFYCRRILRIFPALLLVLFFCIFLGWLLLLADEYKRLGIHVAAGITFLSNFVLWSESGYFDVTSDHKLMLHLWSLAIEEQFYLVWPLLLWVAWRIKRVALCLIILCSFSYILNIFNIRNDVSGTFYLPWYRFWELSIGGLLAYFQYIPKTTRSANTLSMIGILLLIGGFILIDHHRLFPGWWALFPVFGSALLIAAGQSAFFNRYLLSNRLMVGIGLISFPMYLWHWPLLTFSRIYWGQPSNSRLLFVAALCIPLAYLTYRFIERPIRTNRNRVKLKLIGLFFLSVIVCLIGAIIYWTDGIPQRTLANKYHRIEGDLKWTYWENKDCNKLFDASPCQFTSTSPKILLMGDSHANALYPGLAKIASKQGIINIGSCPPLDGILLQVSKNQEHSPGAKDFCMKKNWKILSDTASIDTVVVAMYSQPLLDGRSANEKDFTYWGNVTLQSIYLEERQLSQYQLLENGLLRTLKKINASDKSIIFVRDVPSIGEDFRDYCIQRNSHDAHSFDCSIPRAQYELQRSKEVPLINKIKAELPNVRIFDPVDQFCDQTVCYLIKNGKSLFRDHNHISEHGSILIGGEINRQYLD
jgi:peptidoglycan/LPS O-acetylase OafA/YrhL